MALVELPKEVKEAIADVVRYGIDDEYDDHVDHCELIEHDQDPSSCDGSCCSHICFEFTRVARWLEAIGVKLWA